MRKTLTLFDWIKEIILNKSNYKSFTQDDWAAFNPYLIHQFLSMNPQYLELIDLIQEFHNIEKEKLYRIYSNLIPKNNKTYYPYIKSKTLKLNEDKLKYICTLYECSYQEANEYIGITPPEYLDFILDKFGLDKKEKKKIKS